MTDAFERYVEALGAPRGVELVEFAGRGGVRQPIAGRLGVWLPVVWEAYLVPAHEFVWLARVRPLGVPLMRAGDEFRDGKGRMRVGRRYFEGDGYDRAEYTVLWAWTLLFAPGEVLGIAGVVVEAAGEAAVRIAFPFRTETWEYALRFDEESGLLRVLETHRFEPRSGNALRWSAEVESYGALGGRPGRPCPEAVLTRWQGEPAVRLELERVDVRPSGSTPAP
jgi:hypothetical protein